MGEVTKITYEIPRLGKVDGRDVEIHERNGHLYSVRYVDTGKFDWVCGFEIITANQCERNC